MAMRLDKYIASATAYSRKQVKQLIKNHHVRVNDIIATRSGQPVHVKCDDVQLHHQRLCIPAPRYYMLNKPLHTVCASKDSEHPTVIDLLNDVDCHQLHIAGRLDKTTTGLVLITDDGAWSHRVTSPSRSCFKTYRVTLTETITAEAIQQLEQGVQLHNEPKCTLPARIRRIDHHHIEMSIQEGKYHQIKRMMAAVGHHVSALHRQQIGHVPLDPMLAPGEYRTLTASEIHQFAS